MFEASLRVNRYNHYRFLYTVGSSSSEDSKHIIHTQPLQEIISSIQSYWSELFVSSTHSHWKKSFHLYWAIGVNYLYHPHKATGRNHFICKVLLELIICIMRTEPMEENISSIQSYWINFLYHCTHSHCKKSFHLYRAMGVNYLYHPHTATGRNHFIYTELFELTLILAARAGKKLPFT